MPPTTVVLAATAAADRSFGDIAAICAARGWLYLAAPHQVWYNRGERDRIARALAGAAGLTLVGFSKSGLGALNLALDHPGLAARVVAFDVPMARDPHPGWGVEDFYPDLAAYRDDLPLTRAPRLRAMAAQVRLLHIAGALYADDHDAWHRQLDGAPGYDYLRRPDWPHRWDAGWLDLIA